MAERSKAAGSAPEEIVGYWTRSRDGLASMAAYLDAEVHDGFQNEEVIMCQANSLGKGLHAGARLHRLV